MFVTLRVKMACLLQKFFAVIIKIRPIRFPKYLVLLKMWLQEIANVVQSASTLNVMGSLSQSFSNNVRGRVTNKRTL